MPPMLAMLRVGSVLLLASVLVLGLEGQATVAVGTDVGQAFPTWSLPGLADGQPSSVGRYRGTKVLLHQFASW